MKIIPDGDPTFAMPPSAAFQLQEQSWELGEVVQAVGSPQDTGIEYLDHMGIQRHKVKGDGSCWARSTWLCAFGQIFASDQAFDQFVEQIANPKEGFAIPADLVSSSLDILRRLKNQTANERIEFLNHARVDDTLIFYMRHVSGEYIKKNYSFYSEEDIEDIKTNKYRYGGPEITAFLKYFGLVRYAIAQNDHGEWIYYVDDSVNRRHFKMEELREHLDEFPSYCMFAANENHYEFLSFDKARLLELPVHCGEMKEPLDELAKQIREDHLLAEGLQKKYDREHSESLQKIYLNEMAAQEIQQKVFKELIELESKTLKVEEAIVEENPVPFPKQPIDVVKETVVSVVQVPRKGKKPRSIFQTIGNLFAKFFSIIWSWLLEGFSSKSSDRGFSTAS